MRRERLLRAVGGLGSPTRGAANVAGTAGNVAGLTREQARMDRER